MISMLLWKNNLKNVINFYMIKFTQRYVELSYKSISNVIREKILDNLTICYHQCKKYQNSETLNDKLCVIAVVQIL